MGSSQGFFCSHGWRGNTTDKNDEAAPPSRSRLLSVGLLRHPWDSIRSSKRRVWQRTYISAPKNSSRPAKILNRRERRGKGRRGEPRVDPPFWRSKSFSPSSLRPRRSLRLRFIFFRLVRVFRGSPLFWMRRHGRAGNSVISVVHFCRPHHSSGHEAELRHARYQAELGNEVDCESPRF